MENLGAMADSRYTGFREITDRDVLELHCIHCHLTHLWLLIKSIKSIIERQETFFNKELLFSV